MPTTRKSTEGTVGSKRRSSSRSSTEDSSPTKVRKEGRRGSRSSLRMQNKMSGITLPDIKDDSNLPTRKEKTPKKPSKGEPEHVVEETNESQVNEEPVFTEEERAGDQTNEESDEDAEDSAEATENKTPCSNGGEAEVVKEVSENVDKDNDEESTGTSHIDQETVKEPSPVINVENELVHVQALA